MKYIVEKLTKNDELESKIKVLCSFKNIKFNIKQGRIISIENTNISFIVPHKIILDINKCYYSQSNRYKLSIFFFYFNYNLFFCKSKVYLLMV